jgi:hypothetical protein
MKNANTPIFLILIINILGCGDGSKTREKSAPKKHSTPDVSYNIYIENSGSMAGYLGASSEFKKMLVGFISDIPAHLKKEPQVFLVNEHVCPVAEQGNELLGLIMGLNPGTLKSMCTSTGSSLLPQIIDSCTTQMDRKVSILVSDCIYSNKNGAPTELAEAELKLFMANKLQREGNISTIAIKYNSRFSGLYYSEAKGGKPMKVKDINRPYYLLLFGRKENLAALLQKLDFAAYPGFEASYCLSANDSGDTADAIMTQINKRGSFRVDMPARKLHISEAQAVKGLFQFSFKADLTQLGYLDDYLLDKQSYSVNEGFAVTDIIKSADELPYGITLATNHLLPAHSLRLFIKYDIPAWIDKTGNENDSSPADSIQQHQTYGFKQLMHGISMAYEASSNDHAFKVPIPDIIIKK